MEDWWERDTERQKDREGEHAERSSDWVKISLASWGSNQRLRVKSKSVPGEWEFLQGREKFHQSFVEMALEMGCPFSRGEDCESCLVFCTQVHKAENWDCFLCGLFLPVTSGLHGLQCLGSRSRISMGEFLYFSFTSDQSPQQKIRSKAKWLTSLVGAKFIVTQFPSLFSHRWTMEVHRVLKDFCLGWAFYLQSMKKFCSLWGQVEFSLQFPAADIPGSIGLILHTANMWGRLFLRYEAFWKTCFNTPRGSWQNITFGVCRWFITHQFKTSSVDGLFHLEGEKTIQRSRAHDDINIIVCLLVSLKHISHPWRYYSRIKEKPHLNLTTQRRWYYPFLVIKEPPGMEHQVLAIRKWSI